MTPARQRILFVDDEPDVLQGLRDVMRSQARTWDVSFAESGREALDRFAEAPFDVVVADMRMPGMDGAELLQEVRRRHPQTVRIILSGYAEMESAIRTVPLAHRFVGKPCEPKALRDVLARACSLQGLLDDPALRAHIGTLPALPAAPSVWSRLTTALMDPKTSMGTVGAIVEADPALAARVLHVVNSAFFALPRRVTNIVDAVRILGIRVVKDLALASEALRMFEKHLPPGFDFDDEARRAGATARVARRFAGSSAEAPDAFTGGVLHDLGVLVLATLEPESFGACLREARDSGWSLALVERETERVSHARVGAYVLALWGLPYGLVEAVAWHHEGPAPEGAPRAADFVRLAVRAIEAVEASDRGRELDEPLEAPAWLPGTTVDGLLDLARRELGAGAMAL
ncbi:response regulator [Myxococcota bacterium]|nr:response regulator [Myxococcota bacterium]